MPVTLPAERPYTDTELNWIDSEPPGLLPSDQSGLWGVARKVFADYLQREITDLMESIYNSLDPSTADARGMARWEELLGIPVNTGKTLEERRAFVMSRRERGPFTRSRRDRIIEAFIRTTFGPVPELGLSGIPLTGGGIPLYSGEDSLIGTYHVVEGDPTNPYLRTFDIRLLPSIALDEDGLEREFNRVIPAPYGFTITPHTYPFHNYMTNNSFEATPGGLELSVSAGTPTVTTPAVGGAPHGAQVYRAAGSTAAAIVLLYTTTPSDLTAINSHTPCVPGQRVYLRMSIRRTTANVGDFMFKVRWWNAAGELISTVPVASQAAPALNTWYVLDGAPVAPPNARWAGIELETSFSGAATIEADALMSYPLKDGDTVPSTFVAD